MPTAREGQLGDLVPASALRTPEVPTAREGQLGDLIPASALHVRTC